MAPSCFPKSESSKRSVDSSSRTGPGRISNGSDLESGGLLKSKVYSGRVSDMYFPDQIEAELNQCNVEGLFYPEGKIILVWKRVILVLVAWCSIWTPIEFGFIPSPSVGLMAFGAVVDLFFFADMALRFNTAFRHPKSLDLITSRRRIAIRYLSRGFLLDLLSSIPFNLITYWATGSPAGGALGIVFRALACLRLYRLPHVYHELSLLGRSSYTAFFAIRIAKLGINIILAAHYFGIAYFFLTTLEPDPANTWIGQGLDPNWLELPVFLQYVAAMWWSIFVITSIGPAYTAVTTAEQLFCCVYALFGMAALAYTLGTLTMLMVKSSSKTMEYHQDMNALRNYAARNNLPPAMEKQLEQQLQLRLEQQKTGNAAFLSTLPHHLRVAVTRQLYLPIVQGLPAFSGCSEPFLKQLVTEMETELVAPNSVVVSAGDVATHLYVVLSGKLAREDGPPPANKRRPGPDLLLPGSVFGKAAVMCDVPQLFTVRSLETCQLLRLSKQCFTTILKAYPADCTILLNNLKKKLATGGSSGTGSPMMSRSVSEAALRNVGHLNLSAAEIGEIAADQEAELATGVCAAASNGHREKLTELLEENPSLATCADYNGRTPLHLAAGNGHVSCVTVLMEQGADVNALDRSGASVLLEAAKGGNAAVISNLLKAGAQLRLRDVGATLCRAAAAACKDSSSTGGGGGGGSQGGPSGVRSPRKGSSVDYLRRLLDCGADSNAQDYAGCSALHIACLNRSHHVVEVLLSYGADPNLADVSGSTPLTIASESGDAHLLKLLSAQSAHLD